MSKNCWFRGKLYLQQCFVANVKCSTRGFVITTSIWRCKTRLLGNDVLFCFDWDQLTHHQYLHQHSQHINHINSCNQQNISPVGGSATRREENFLREATLTGYCVRLNVLPSLLGALVLLIQMYNWWIQPFEFSSFKNNDFGNPTIKDCQ